MSTMTREFFCDHIVAREVDCQELDVAVIKVTSIEQDYTRLALTNAPPTGETLPGKAGTVTASLPNGIRSFVVKLEVPVDDSGAGLPNQNIVVTGAVTDDLTGFMLEYSLNPFDITSTAALQYTTAIGCITSNGAEPVAAPVVTVRRTSLPDAFAAQSAGTPGIVASGAVASPATSAVTKTPATAGEYPALSTGCNVYGRLVKNNELVPPV